MAYDYYLYKSIADDPYYAYLQTKEVAMLINPEITDWNKLITSLGLDSNLQDKDITTLNEWCKINISSKFSNKNLKNIRNIFDSYLELNSQDSLTKIVDEELGYTVAHKATKLGFDSFLDKCLQECNDEVKKRILSSKSKQGNTPLHIAANQGQTNMVELLLDNLADPNLFNDANKLPIHLAAIVRKDAEKLTCVELLLTKTDSKNLTTVDNIGMPLLLTLVPFDNIKIIKKVLEKNTDQLTLQDGQGQNILHLAIIQQSRNLVDHFAGDEELLRQRTNNNATALHLACRYGDESIIHKIHNQNLKFKLNNLDSKDEHGKTPLDYLNERKNLRGVHLEEQEQLSRLKL